MAILVRYTPNIEIFLIQRSEALKAYPGYWAFPGGRTDDTDSCYEETALRELFEETGLLLLSDTSKQPSLKNKQALHNKLNTGELSWENTRHQLGYPEAPDKFAQFIKDAPLNFVGWRVAPPIHPIRFEAAYYYAEYTGSDSILLSEESQHAKWWKPLDLIAAWRNNEALVPAPVMGVLKALSTVKEKIAHEHKTALQAIANTREQMYVDMEVHPQVEMIPLRTPTLVPATHTNTYLVGKTSFVIIDPATPYPQEQQELKHRIQQRLDLGHTAKAVLLTHHHQDHVGAANEIRNWLNIPVAAHKKTTERLKEQTWEPAIAIDQQIEDGHVWQLNSLSDPLYLKALFTPGHAPGHLCFIGAYKKDLPSFGIVGDMVAGIGSIVIQHPKNSVDPDGNMKDYLASLQRLKDLKLKRVFPAHGPMITKPDAYFQKYIDHRLAREEQILTALQTHQKGSMQQLRTWVYPTLDKTLFSFAEDSLRAHLVKLQEENKIEQFTQAETIFFQRV